MSTTEPNLATATAHRAWDERWRTEAGREEWLKADPDVVAVLPLLRERGVRRVLDLGCGVGRHARVLAAAGFETFALDGSEGGVAHLRGAAAADGLAIDLRIGLMTGLPSEGGAFDYVLAFNVIYHGDPTVVARAVAEIRRVLRPGGLYQGTMLSKRNERYGRGVRVAPDTFVLDEDGDTAHPHFYCNAAELVGLFRGFEPLSLVDRLHRKPGSWHWHVLAERLAT
ncbi:MAG TPA: class I SAM-dependent methyltransferase [Geminicoccaceae bacterium]|nr:class I SAM-dependent methyltransferase [Geminicoccaceae bacterium]